MKKKIVVGFSALTILFVASYVYIVRSIEGITASMDKLILLHQVEILREHLLIRIKEVETDLTLKNTRHARGVDIIVSHVQEMEGIANACFDCHHRPEVISELVRMRDEIESYKTRLSRALTLRANAARLMEEEDSAFRAGQALMGKVNTMVVLTRSTLNQKTKENLQSIAHAKVLLFAIIALVPVVGIVMAFVFIRGITKPVHELLKATRSLRGGDLDYRVKPLHDEFGEVGDSFNEMASSLKEQMQKMHRVEQMTVVGQMATMLAHEIKNPLAGIKASMQVLHEDEALSEEDRSLLLKVIDEVRRIELLLKSLLDFGRPPKTQLIEASVNDIIEKTLSYSFKHPAKITVTTHLDNQVPLTMLDPMQLQQVFLNLFLNAADAMPDGGTITITTSCDTVPGNSVQISIEDTGKGIPQGKLEQIFEPFFTTKAKGTGLGLAICKQLIDQHGGTIAANINERGGSTFTIILPVRQGPETATT